MNFRKVIKYGNPVPPMKQACNTERTCIYNTIAMPTGIASAILYINACFPMYYAAESALYGDMERAVGNAGSAIVLIGGAYVSAALANLFRNKANAHHHQKEFFSVRR